MKFKIDKHIPAPVKRVGYPRSRLLTYPELKAGESFFVPGKRACDLSVVMALRRPQVHTCKTRIERGRSGVRCWRIS